MLESGDPKGWGLEAMEDTWSKSQGGGESPKPEFPGSQEKEMEETTEF